jgi:hypothetical protein
MIPEAITALLTANDVVLSGIAGTSFSVSRCCAPEAPVGHASGGGRSWFEIDVKNARALASFPEFYAEIAVR